MARVRPIQPALTSILFDPLDWLPPACVPLVVPAQWLDLCSLRCDVRPAAWINQVIIDTHNLACTFDDRIEGSNPAVWINNWRRLRHAAWLAGCRCLRDTLVTTGRFSQLGQTARDFALLPVIAPRPCTVLQTRVATDLSVLLAQGYRCLFQKSATHSDGGTALPLALRQRLALMFADAQALIDRVAPTANEVTSLATFPTLFDTALAHAQIHQNAYAVTGY